MDSTEQAVVVAVDGSEHNREALDWAADQAALSGMPLRLVTVAETFVFPVPYPVAFEPQDLEAVLDDAATRVAARHRDLEMTRSVLTGPAVSQLLDYAAQRSLLVVGRRGLGAFGRMLVGSTSIAVAGRCSVPVVVVPDRPDREPPAPAGRVVVGIDPQEQHDHLLGVAVDQARIRRASLEVVHAIHVPLLLVGDPVVTKQIHDDVSQGGRAKIEESLQPWRTEFPDLTIRIVQQEGHPGQALLSVAEGADLLIVGRHRESRWGGFGIGSTTRGVLHYADIPVAVVPS